MIKDGDNIFVGLSGGKDSVLLMSALAAYRKFSPEKFTLSAITVDMGFKDTPIAENDALSEYCKTLGVERHIVKTDIAEIVFDARKESNPCSLCAKFRRGALNSEINRLGGGKLALGHNADDVAETMLMSLLYEGRFSCFAPTAYMDKSGVELIRPFIYIEEYDISATVKRLGLPIVKILARRTMYRNANTPKISSRQSARTFRLQKSAYSAQSTTPNAPTSGKNPTIPLPENPNNIWQKNRQNSVGFCLIFALLPLISYRIAFEQRTIEKFRNTYSETLRKRINGVQSYRMASFEPNSAYCCLRYSA